MSEVQTEANIECVDSESEVVPMKPQKQEIHPIALAINTYLHRARDCEESARVFISMYRRIKKSSLQQVRSKLKKGSEILNNEPDEATAVAAMNMIGGAIRKVDRLKNSNIEETLERSLFLNLFSAFDAFTGDLLATIYSKKPELYGHLNREIKLSELLAYESFEDLKAQILQEEIESFRRKSYVEQFEALEKRFSITLRNFSKWKDFVECSQRRNLMTHCDGVVSDQYIKICKDAGYCHSENLNKGDRLSLGPDYFLPACSLMMEVALKLGHTLWRKIFPEEIPTSDTYIQTTIYDFLQDENYKLSVIIGEFAIKLPNVSSDLEHKINTVNYAIALKFGNSPEKAIEILSKVDWSAASNDFKIAEAVLNDRFDEAAMIMERIGKRGDLITERSYHEWPLFKEFRESEQFMKAYENIFGHSFIAELERTVEKVEEESRIEEELGTRDDSEGAIIKSRQ